MNVIRKSVALFALTVLGCGGTNVGNDELGTTNQAYSFGRFYFASITGGEAYVEPGCTEQIPHSSLEAWEEYDGVEAQHKWGPDAIKLLQNSGLPTQITDEGTNCARYNGTVSYLLNNEWKSTYSSNFRAGFTVQAENDPTHPPDGYVFWMYKNDVCSGINNWHAERGAGGPWGSWAVRATYYRSGSSE